MKLNQILEIHLYRGPDGRGELLLLCIIIFELDRLEVQGDAKGEFAAMVADAAGDTHVDGSEEQQKTFQWGF